mmetsp:Transcript_28801/g.85215  ORF Transcript_28801/g.85215 Transcript_28801/m.85215 type:complete len:226 (-) Transcript_28801:7-684(-)
MLARHVDLSALFIHLRPTFFHSLCRHSQSALKPLASQRGADVHHCVLLRRPCNTWRGMAGSPCCTHLLLSFPSGTMHADMQHYACVNAAQHMHPCSSMRASMYMCCGAWLLAAVSVAAVAFLSGVSPGPPSMRHGTWARTCSAKTPTPPRRAVRARARRLRLRVVRSPRKAPQRCRHASPSPLQHRDHPNVKAAAFHAASAAVAAQATDVYAAPEVGAKAEGEPV